MRVVLLWFHILGAGTWLGSNVMQAAASRGMISGDSTAALRWMQSVRKVSSPVYGVVWVVILLTGIFLVLDSGGDYSFKSTFVEIGIAVVIIGGALAGLVFSRQSKNAIALYQAGKAAETASIHRNIAIWGTVDTLLVAIAVLAMVARWGA